MLKTFSVKRGSRKVSYENDARDDELRACETGRLRLCTFACNDSGKCGGLLWMMPDADHFSAFANVLQQPSEEGITKRRT